MITELSPSQWHRPPLFPCGRRQTDVVLYLFGYLNLSSTEVQHFYKKSNQLCTIRHLSKPIRWAFGVLIQGQGINILSWSHFVCHHAYGLVHLENWTPRRLQLGWLQMPVHVFTFGMQWNNIHPCPSLVILKAPTVPMIVVIISIE